VTRLADSMVVSATIEPTDRSIPPDRMTNVMPTATISRKALSISRFMNTCAERNPGYLSEPARNIRMNSPMVTRSGI